MARKANPTIIGAFVVSAMFLAILSVLLLGGGITAESWRYVAYFDESLKGLEVGAPVIFKGVKIGSVVNIEVIADTESFAIKTPVVFEIDPSNFVLARGGIKLSGPEATMKPESAQILVEVGLRAQLEMQSLVTGKQLIALDYHPDTPIRLTGASTEYIEIPTIPSTSVKLARTLDEMPLDEIMEAVLGAFKSARDLLGDPNLKLILADAEAALVDARQLIRRVDGHVDPVASELNLALQDARGLIRNIDGEVKPASARFGEAAGAARDALTKASEALEAARGAVAEDSPLQQELLGALREITAAARSVRVLSEYLERHPEALIQGKGGQ